jgi:lysine 2,3-aminomutase
MKTEDLYPVFGPKSYFSWIQDKPELKKQFLPDPRELNPIGFLDPIGDQVHQKTGMLIHRYKNRALFIPTNKCPINCRYCFRKNELLTSEETFSEDFKTTIEYLALHPEIQEIIFTGGDPFMISDEKIQFYLTEFSKISHLKLIRFHTRTPVISPKRLTLQLKNLLHDFSKRFFMNIVLHTNHLSELSDEFKATLFDFQTLEIPWLSQTVLLREVNNDSLVLKDLFYSLSLLKIRPYYLHHPDQVKGAMHFYLSIEEGRKIYHELRQQLPGWMLPHYIVDIPHGFGKNLAYNSEHFSFTGQFIDLYGNEQHYKHTDLSES